MQTGQQTLLGLHVTVTAPSKASQGLHGTGGNPGARHQTSKQGQWGKHQRCSHLGTVTPALGDRLRGQHLPQSMCQGTGRDRHGLLSLFHGLCPPPAPARQAEPPGAALAPTDIFLSPIRSAKVAPAFWAIVLAICKQAIKTFLLSRRVQQRNKKRSYPGKSFYSSCSKA